MLLFSFPKYDFLTCTSTTRHIFAAIHHRSLWSWITISERNEHKHIFRCLEVIGQLIESLGFRKQNQNVESCNNPSGPFDNVGCPAPIPLLIPALLPVSWTHNLICVRLSYLPPWRCTDPERPEKRRSTLASKFDALSSVWPLRWRSRSLPNKIV